MLDSSRASPNAFALLCFNFDYGGLNLAEVRQQDHYDKHPAVMAAPDAMDRKFATEEDKSYHLPFPHFFPYFVFSFMLNNLRWENLARQGGICIDCTNGPWGQGYPGLPNAPSPPSAAQIGYG